MSATPEEDGLADSGEADLAPWKRLGQMLTVRRIELDPRNQNRRRFADQVGINYRVLFDIEQGKRANFSPNMITAIETAYGWEAGSVEEVLQGGDPQPVAEAGAPKRQPITIPAHVDLASLPAWERDVWLIPSLSEEERALVIQVMKVVRSRG